MMHSASRIAIRKSCLRLGASSALALAAALAGTPASAAAAAAAADAAAAAAEGGPVHIDPETPDFGRQVDELVVTGASGARQGGACAKAQA